MIRTVKIEMIHPFEGLNGAYSKNTFTIANQSNKQLQRIAVNLDEVSLIPGETKVIRIQPINNRPFEFENNEFLVVDGLRVVGKGELID